MYLRYRTTTPEGEWSDTLEQSTSADSVEFALVGLTANTEYEVQASFEDTFPEDTSPSTTFTTATTVPGSPQNVAATPGMAELVVTWEAPEDDGGSPITGYIVQWKSGEEDFNTEREGKVDGETLTHAISDLDSDIEYTVQVLTSNENGSGAPSETATGTPLPVIGSMIDAVSVESDGPKTAKVSVVVSNANEDEPVTVHMRYRVASESSGGEGASAGQPAIEQVGTSQQVETGEWSEIQSVETTTGIAEFTLVDLVQDEEYEIQVSLEETFSDDAFVSSITFTPARVPGAPTGVVLTPGDAEISVSWSPPADDGGSPITEYIVQWKSGDEEFDTTRRAQADVQSLIYTIDELTNGVEYDVQVIAANVIGEGAASTVASATPTPAVTATISRIRILEKSQTSAKAEVTIANRDTSVTAAVYLRYRATSPQQAWSSTMSEDATTDTVEFNLSGLTAGTAYEVQASLEDTFPEDARVSVTFATQSAPQPPRITSARSFTVDEGETRVATLTASDADTPTSQLAWSILPSSVDGDKFMLSGMGALYYRSAKDYENPDDANGDGTYELTVWVSDGQNTDSAMIRITLLDVVEDVAPPPTPTISADYHAATYSVREGSSVSISVRLSSAPSAPIGIPIRANAGGTAESGDYTILGLTGGSLTFSPGQLLKSFIMAANHDSESDNETIQLGFGVLPEGVSPGVNRMTSVAIIDDDVASDTVRSGSRGRRNSPPRFTEEHNAIRSVEEKSPLGSEVGAPIAAMDANRQDQDSLTYLLAGANASDFAIDSATGQLLTGTELDFEEKSNYRVVVLVDDGRGGRDAISVSIFVIDVNEPPLISGATSIDYSENSSVAVGEFDASDPEGDPNLTWSLAGEDGDAFSIDATGTLTFKASPNFEEPVDSDKDNRYSIKVEASDGNSIGKTEVTVVVIDTDDQGVVILSNEPARVGKKLEADLTGHDRDLSDIVWTWERSSDGVIWRVISGAESSSYTPVEEDKGTYLRVTAAYSDMHGSVKSLRATTESPVQQVPQATPTFVPTRRPTATPTHLPMAVPTLQPSPSPTPVPVIARTSLPAAAPTATSIPTRTPTAVPTTRPTATAVPTTVETKTSVSATATPMAAAQPAVRDAEDSEVPINPLVLLLIAALVGITSIALVIRIRRRRA